MVLNVNMMQTATVLVKNQSATGRTVASGSQLQNVVNKHCDWKKYAPLD
jgi:hypothetical protein